MFTNGGELSARARVRPQRARRGLRQFSTERLENCLRPAPCQTILQPFAPDGPLPNPGTLIPGP